MTKVTNVVLDLDNTLISAIDAAEQQAMGKTAIAQLQSKFRWENMEDEFMVFERPYLQRFLTWLFRNFNVSVWTAASKTYASFIVERFVAGPDRTLDFVLFSDHCKQSQQACNAHKNLSMMSSIFPTGYNPAETLIIDDHDEVYHTQPARCIRVQRFDATDSRCTQDTELLSVLKQLRQLK